MKSDSERTGGAAVAGAAPCYALRDTRIEMAGVMRCCLATVAEEYEGGDKGQDKTVTIGMKSKCRHCNQTFTLVEAKPHPKWKPDWQLNGHNGRDEMQRSCLLHCDGSTARSGGNQANISSRPFSGRASRAENGVVFYPHG